MKLVKLDRSAAFLNDELLETADSLRQDLEDRQVVAYSLGPASSSIDGRPPGSGGLTLQRFQGAPRRQRPVPLSMIPPALPSAAA